MSSRAIAVLPFIDLSVGKTEQPFCDGVAEEISNWLAQIPMLRVVARSSAFAFRDRQTDVREIGRQLGTTHVLEGSLRRAGNVTRVSVQLIATRDGYNVWSGSYDTAATNVIQVQEEVARAVASNLELRLTGAQSQVRANGVARAPRPTRLTSLRAIISSNGPSRITSAPSSCTGKPSISTQTSRSRRSGLAYAYLNQRYFNDRPIADIARDARRFWNRPRSRRRASPICMWCAVRSRPSCCSMMRHSVTCITPRRSIPTRGRQPPSSVSTIWSTVSHAMRCATTVTPPILIRWITTSRRNGALRSQTSANMMVQPRPASRSRSLNPQSAWAYSVSSDLEEARGRLVEALRWNGAALARSPDAGDVYAQRGHWLLSLGLPQRARESYDAAVVATGDPAPVPGSAGLGS